MRGRLAHRITCLESLAFRPACVEALIDWCEHLICVVYSFSIFSYSLHSLCRLIRRIFDDDELNPSILRPRLCIFTGVDWPCFTITTTFEASGVNLTLDEIRFHSAGPAVGQL